MTRIRLFLFIITILAPSLAAAQQSMKFEEAGAMLAASCGKDIDDNCRGVNLDATRLRECLNRNHWTTLREARVVIGDFKRDHNRRHRHSALGYLTPAEYAGVCRHTRL